jgi:DNA-binding MarR family transcriptional regulator
MENQLQKDLIHAIFRFKRNRVNFPNKLGNDDPDVSMAEMVLLKEIAGKTCDDTSARIHDILCVTRPALSQMLGTLEKKGYLTRDINKENRRRIVLSLTEKGTALVGHIEKQMETMLSEIIARFGEENTAQLITLINQFTDIIEDIRC